MTQAGKTDKAIKPKKSTEKQPNKTSKPENQFIKPLPKPENEGPDKLTSRSLAV
jgi:hypothetical protein